VEALREQLSEWRQEGDHIALVPTMGNLHAGHMSLIEIAREHAERVVVSIFVNPTLFENDDDFEEFPRPMERDRRRLDRANVDVVFQPDVETMYPFGIDNATSVTVPALSDELCGSFRPGHFNGVTSVVTRLFNLVQPDVAVFGQKNYQQQLVVNRLAADLNLPIKIICGETVREDDGLAMSSRNRHLSAEERALSTHIFTTIQAVGRELENGQRNYADLEDQAIDKLQSLGFTPEYVSIRRAENLDAPDRDCDELVVLVSAWLGDAHLIDNLVVHI